MNLAEALNAALPDLPVKQKGRSGFPKLDPLLIWNENVEDGKPVIAAHIRGGTSIFRFPPEQWSLIELFNGERSYEELAELYQQKYGVQLAPDDIHELANNLDEIDFWYKTPQEKNIALSQKLAEQRHQHQHRKSKWGDVAHMQFSAWDPDRYFDLIYPRVKFVFSTWFTAATLALFTFMGYIFIANWGEIGRDTLRYYTFTDKGARDLAEFWILFLILAFFHESSHGLTCKHYGGQVHRMGFHLIYLSPAFFVDVTEAWVYANRWQRFLTILAGIWAELIFCALASVIWWGTPAGTYTHELAYKVMLITGVAVVVVNMNPLIKLDGYYAFSEIIGFADIKEKSTAFLSTWIRRHVFGLPVEVEYVAKRRRVLFVIYAVLSGLYSYLLLFAVVRFARNVFSNYSREWAFVPALLLAYFIFRSRIRIFARFVNTVYLDKKDRFRAWFTVPRTIAFLVLLAVILFAPVWRKTVHAKFVMEPIRRETVRAAVPGNVVAVYVREGDKVTPGQPLLRLHNYQLESELNDAQTKYALAEGKQIIAQLNSDDLGSSVEESKQYAIESAATQHEVSNLTPVAPIQGTVLSNNLRDLKGTHLDAGAAVAEIADTSTMRVRMFVPEFQVHEIQANDEVRLLPDSRYQPIDTTVSKVLPTSADLSPGLEPPSSYKGLANTKYYVAEAYLTNDGRLRDQMSGTAKIMIGRTSLAGMISQDVRDFVDRKAW